MPRDWLQLVYLGVAVLLVGFLGLFAFALVFNEVTILGWLFVAGYFAFRHWFTQYRNRLAVSGTATAKASSAAIGLTELSGRGHAEQTSPAAVSETPCLFWSVDVHQWQWRSKRRGWHNTLHKSFGVLVCLWRSHLADRSSDAPGVRGHAEEGRQGLDGCVGHRRRRVFPQQPEPVWRGSWPYGLTYVQRPHEPESQPDRQGEDERDRSRERDRAEDAV